MKTLLDTFTNVESPDLLNLLATLLDKRPDMDASHESTLVYTQQGRSVIVKQLPKMQIPQRMYHTCDAVGEINLEVIRRTPNPPAPTLVQPRDLALITIQFLKPVGPAKRPVLTLLVPFSDPMFDWSPRVASVEAAYLLKLGEIFEEYRDVERVTQAWVQSKLLSELEEECLSKD